MRPEIRMIGKHEALLSAPDFVRITLANALAVEELRQILQACLDLGPPTIPLYVLTIYTTAESDHSSERRKLLADWIRNREGPVFHAVVTPNLKVRLMGTLIWKALRLLNRKDDIQFFAT